MLTMILDEMALVIRERGYLVLCWVPGQVPGTIASKHQVLTTGQIIVQPMAVICQTDYADYMEQMALLRREAFPRPRGHEDWVHYRFHVD
jgi:hypothetical protein